jgi:hypothetical protein
MLLCCICVKLVILYHIIVDIFVGFSFGLWREGCVIQVSFPFNFKRGTFMGNVWSAMLMCNSNPF